GGVSAKAWSSNLVPLVRFTDLSDTADGHLRRQAKPLPQLSVVSMLQFDLVRRTNRECLSSQPVGSLIEPLDCGLESCGLFSIRKQLDLQRQLHTQSIDKNNHYSSLKGWHSSAA